MDVMYDLETLGTSPDSVILEIGAVAFDPRRVYSPDEIDQLRTFNVRIMPMQEGRRMDPGTIKWWSEQERPFREVLGGTVPIYNALVDFRAWAMSNEAKTMWCWGATFDHVLLTHALNQHKVPVWLNFRDWLCARTVNHLAPIDKKPIQKRWQSHGALTDSKSQTFAICQSLAKIRGMVVPLG